MPDVSGRACEGCADIYQAMKRERKIQENRGTCANDSGIERTGLSVCEWVKGKLAGDKGSLANSGRMVHGFMGYKKSFSSYPIVIGENFGQTGCKHFL